MIKMYWPATRILSFIGFSELSGAPFFANGQIKPLPVEIFLSLLYTESPSRYLSLQIRIARRAK